MRPPPRVALALLVIVTGCAGASRWVAPPADERQGAWHISQWLAQHPLPRDEEIAVAELGRTEASSLHIVHIRGREALHVHERHDLVALLHRGHGTLRVGSTTLHLREGSVVAIPRGVPHAFVNESRRPAAAVVVFSPPFDGADTIPATDSP